MGRVERRLVVMHCRYPVQALVARKELEQKKGQRHRSMHVQLRTRRSRGLVTYMDASSWRHRRGIGPDGSIGSSSSNRRGCSSLRTASFYFSSRASMMWGIERLVYLCVCVCVLGLNSITIYVLLVGKREKESREKERTHKKRRSKRNRPGREEGRHVRIDLMQSWLGSIRRGKKKTTKERKKESSAHTHTHISNSYHSCSIPFPFSPVP